VSTPVLHLLGGPNGSGKSTFVDRVLTPVTHLPFVNADLIAAERWPDRPIAHAYDAARAAAAERQRFLTNRASFIAETVFSHPSKVDLVTQAIGLGYVVHLHVMLVPVELSVSRVAERVRRGGHEVPEAKIRERYERLWPLVAEARATADRTSFYDNSGARTPFRVVATYERGREVGTPQWPRWAPTVFVR
jgi:predicted ABC-type ATPase